MHCSTQKRAIDFDILRVIVILSALLQHYNSVIGDTFLNLPTTIIQQYFFTVGAFFFFTAGYMARKIYIPKFYEQPIALSRKIIIKGVGILSVYVSYVFLLHIFTDTPVQMDVLYFVADHKFNTKVLFPFAMLYILSPLFFYMYSRNKVLLSLLILLLFIIVVSHNILWTLNIPYTQKKLLIDRGLFSYPLLSSILIYSIGFLISSMENICGEMKYSFLFILFIVAVIFVHIFLVMNVKEYHDIVSKKSYYLIVECITPYLAIIVVRFFTRYDFLYKYLSSSYVMCIGVCSLHFYIIMNLILFLLQIPRDADQFTKVAGLVGVFGLTYLFTFWKYSSAIGVRKKQVV
ncbi:hypothetical protein [Desulforhopalus sp. 52FAK]